MKSSPTSYQGSIEVIGELFRKAGPTVVLTGSDAPSACRARDLKRVAGSSLPVLPVADLPKQAVTRDAHLIILNNSPTYFDVFASSLFQGNLADALPAFAEQVFYG